MFLILVKYYLRSISKRTLGLIPFLIFLLALLLFAVILLPSFGQRLRESSLLSFGQLTLRVAGTVSKKTKNASGVMSVRPVSGVVIESGGFRTTSNFAGAYELKFRSQQTQDIALIVRYDRREIIDRISFPLGEYKMQKDFTFR
jgi:hypothetical protein